MTKFHYNSQHLIAVQVLIMKVNIIPYEIMALVNCLRDPEMLKETN